MLLAASGGNAKEPADPPYYVKRATWQETLLQSRLALARQERAGAKAADFRPYLSPILRGGEPARQISASVAGQQEMHLYVLGAPDVVAGAVDWADAKLIGNDGKQSLLCELKSIEVLEGRHSEHVTLESGVSGPMRIAGKELKHGIHAYAYSKIRVPLGSQYERFEATVGIDDWVGKRGAVRCLVTNGPGGARQDLWMLLRRDFPDGRSWQEIRWEQEDRILEADWAENDWADLARRYAKACHRVPPIAAQAAALAAKVRDAAGLERVRRLYCQSRAADAALNRARALEVTALRLAISDLRETFGPRYARGEEFLAQLSQLEKEVSEAVGRCERGDLSDYQSVVELLRQFDALRREALLDANPLVDFDRLLLVERRPHGDARWPTDTGYGMGEYIGLPRQSSKQHPDIDHPFDWDNRIAVLSPVRPEGELTTLYQPEGRRLATDVDLHWDADRLLFSMPGSHNKWQIFEIGTDGKGLRQVTPGDQPDVHFYDACYLPSGKIAMQSTAPLQGVPCNAGVIVGMTYVMDADGRNIHQICFEQDHNYCPSVTNDGRILYLRWDYTDTPHVWNRMLFTMNPDGTGQSEYYGSNSYWPNAIFYARAVPGHPTKVAGIVTGHHVGRVGELVIFDPAKGRVATDGVVQRIPGRGQKVEPLIQDKLTEHSWPKFLHPYPLSEKYFLAACKPTPEALWGIYLVDVFDNMVLVKEVEGQTLLEPIPLRKTQKPPVIPERVDPRCKDALVYMADIYQGPGLKDVPRGTVKRLRVFTYHFGFQRIAGIDHRVGADGPWEVKRVLGTVPVEEDGSALFRIPAKTPISVQPLDAEGRAVQLMRSWMTAMPGETLSCVGCHEKRNTAPPVHTTIAGTRPPSGIEPWRGPTRGFSFGREVQPVLDKYCVGCHNSQPDQQGRQIVDLRGQQNAFVVFRGGDPQGQVVRDVPKEKLLGKYGGVFPPSYLTLRSFVRVGGLESDLHVLPPLEFHADTTELVQMLRKGHHHVQMDDEAWDRLYTWIDLNAPCHGTWAEVTRIPGDQRQRRCELRRLYGGVEEDAEEVPEVAAAPLQAILPEPEGNGQDTRADKPPVPPRGRVALPAGPAVEQDARAGKPPVPPRRTVTSGGVQIEMVKIPAGSFVMGDARGYPDERPLGLVKIDKPFWMSKCEITNRQYAEFDPTHDSRFEHRTSWIFSEQYLGWALGGSEQPVVRVSWNQAMAFCRWLSQQTGMEFTLPTEAEWEYACRAGTATPLWYGDLDTDFSQAANMADYSIRNLAYEGWPPRSPDIAPRDARFNDHALVTAAVGSYRANPWGLCDMHGNAAEWTRSTCAPYPYRADDGRNDPGADGLRVVRGGSWYDRPQRCRSAFRLAYAPYQRVFNVGFRVVCESP